MTERLFTTFNFTVLVTLDGDSAPLVEGGFANVDGLEMTNEVKTIRQGGDNDRPIHLVGPVSYPNLVLKRGMTSSFGLWTWFDRVLRQGERHLRATTEVISRAADRTEQFSFRLTECLPVKLRAPALAASDGLIAVEELHIAYELLTLRPPKEPADA